MNAEIAFDPFHKQLVVAAMQEAGRCETQHAVERGMYFADVWFEPSETPGPPRPELGFWNVITRTHALIEVFRSTPTAIRLTDVVAKTLNKERGLRPDPDHFGTMLTWVLSPGKPVTGLEGWRSRRHRQAGWPRRGLFHLAGTVPIFVIVVQELPITPNTLVLRLFGTGRTLQNALLELANIRQPWATTFKEILVERHVMVAQAHYPRDENDEDFILHFANVAKQFVHDIRQEGREEGREEGALRPLLRLLQLRLGRSVTAAEQEALRLELATTDHELLTERIFTESAQDLVAWLEATGAEAGASRPR